MECLTNEVDRIALDKQAAEDICESLRATVAGKQQTIGELQLYIGTNKRTVSRH